MGNGKSKLARKLSTSKKQTESNVLGSQYLDEEKELTYHLSNHDDNDIDRHHSNHFFRRYIFQGNFSAPIEERLIQGCKVLDVGCGPGTWLLELANKYEDSRFFGLDVSPVYPNEIKPDNLEFCEADMFNGLPYPDNEFDFVHQESMSFMIKADQWDYVISELVRVTKPGGFIELVEFISPNNSGPILDKVYQTHSDLCLERGVDMSLIPFLDEIIGTHQDITEVHRDERTFIIGPNGGKAGMVIFDVILTFNTSETAIRDIPSRQGISKEEYVNMFVNDLSNEVKVTKPELNVCRFWAQKN